MGEHTIEVDSEEAGVLIGKKGETIKEIQKWSGARVTIASTGHVRAVHISAQTEESINKALDAMKRVIREDLPSARGAKAARAASPPRAAPGQKKPALPSLNWR